METMGFVDLLSFAVRYFGGECADRSLLATVGQSESRIAFGTQILLAPPYLVSALCVLLYSLASPG